MTILKIACRCGQLTATIDGKPDRVSVCHCRTCRRSTGGVFSGQARFAENAVAFAGRWNVWERGGESGTTAWYRWCPSCGSSVAFTNESLPGSVAVLLGAIVEGTIPTPGFSVYEERKLPWVEIVGDQVAHID